MLLEKSDSYEKVCENFRWTIPDRFNIAHVACDRWADREPGRTAILEWTTDGRLPATSYGDIASQSRRLANALRKSGVLAGDRVALLLPQCIETVVAHIAVYRLGAIAVPLALLFGPEALAFRLKFSGARAVITNAAGFENLTSIDQDLPDLSVVYCTDGAVGIAKGFQAEIARSSEQFTNVDTRRDTPALMIFTSGTTGPPKGALHGHQVVAGHLPGFMMLHEFSPQKNDRYWTPADWAWAGGLLNVLMPGLILGVPVVSCAVTKFSPEWAFELMTGAKVRNVFIPPTALKIMKSIDRPQARFEYSLRTVFSGGEALGRETFEWGKEAFNLNINEGYGQTECNLVLTSCSALGISRPGSMGKPAPGHRVDIVRSDGSVCDIEETGQIAIQRPDPVMFLNYWNRPEATSDKFINNWMMTGDQGFKDSDGYFHFVGRDDDIITSAGFRIGPGEIEDCLIGHPAVKLAAAVGKPDSIRTEIVKCYVVLEDGFEENDATRSDIVAHVRSRLSAHEYPREVDFVSEMPLTTTGKVIRRTFRERAKAERRNPDC